MKDRELEQLLRLRKTPFNPLLRGDRLQQDDVALGELQLSHYRLRQAAEHQLRLAKGMALITPSIQQRGQR